MSTCEKRDSCLIPLDGRDKLLVNRRAYVHSFCHATSSLSAATEPSVGRANQHDPILHQAVPVSLDGRLFPHRGIHRRGTEAGAGESKVEC